MTASTSNADLIASEARKIGREPTPERLEAMTLALNAAFAARDRETGVLAFETGETFAAWLLRETADAPAALPVAARPTSPPASSTPPGRELPVAARRTDAFGRIAHGFAIAHQAAAETAKATIAKGNPWAPGHQNRTAQAVITKYDPAIAARMKADAGVVERKNYNWS